MEEFENDPEYQAYIDECCRRCTCDHSPCGGVMSGGYCDEINFQHEEPENELWHSENDEDFIL